MTMSQQRIEVTLAGQKITLATTTEHEPLLREACAMVDEQIQLAIAGGNRSIERATMMAALKLAGDLISSQRMAAEAAVAPSTETAAIAAEELVRLDGELRNLEGQVDALMQTLSLPGSPRPIDL
jgi:cell division protein ZapA